jgi:hypothetical protein
MMCSCTESVLPGCYAGRRTALTPKPLENWQARPPADVGTFVVALSRRADRMR